MKEVLIHLDADHPREPQARDRITKLTIGLGGLIANTVVEIGADPVNRIEEVAAEHLDKLPQALVDQFRGTTLTQLEISLRDERSEDFLEAVSQDDLISRVILATPGCEHLVSESILDRIRPTGTATVRL